jgi:adenine-specific DNA-methyltransferase
MILNFEGKKSEKEILDSIKPIFLKSISGNPKSKSKLIKGDNLEVMKYLIDKYDLKGKIDLVYIDPPFSTNNIFRMSKDKANTISRSNGDNIAYDDSLIGPEYLEFI